MVLMIMTLLALMVMAGVIGIVEAIDGQIEKARRRARNGCHKTVRISDGTRTAKACHPHQRVF